MVAPQQQIGQGPEGHQPKHNNNPAYLITWVALIPHNPSCGQHRKHQKKPFHPVEIHAVTQHNQSHDIQNNLGNDEHRHNPKPVKQHLANFTQNSLHSLSLAVLRSRFGPLFLQHYIFLSQRLTKLRQQRLVEQSVTFELSAAVRKIDNHLRVAGKHPQQLL